MAGIMIEEYRFGSITIDGKTYDYDIEIRWTGEILKWWRKESHIIDLEDIQRAIDQNPDTIIIGSGESGLAKVTERLKENLKSKGIELIIDQTEQATRTFNIMVEEHSSSPPFANARVNDESAREEGEQREVIGLFHLTC